MGVILDASPVISAERAGQTASAFLTEVLERFGDQEIALSAVSYTELVHGTFRALTKTQQALSRRFLHELQSQISVYPYTHEVAEIAGEIDASQRIAGLPIPFADLLIGATALHLDYAILTANERHFRMIPNLQVLTF